MTLTISPDAALWDDMLHDTCTVEPYISDDEVTGQPVYGLAYAAACRIESTQHRTRDEQGVIHLAKGTRIFFSASDPITSRSRVTLAADYSVSDPVVVDVDIVKDDLGEVVYKVGRF